MKIFILALLFSTASYAGNSRIFRFDSYDPNKTFVAYILGFGKSPQESIDARIATDTFYLSHYREHFDFLAIPLLSEKSDYTSVINATKERVIRISQDLSNLPHKKIILVGHSSGSLMAIEISKRVKDKELALVSIDGFAPTNLVPQHIPQTCWTAINGTLRSYNYSTAMTCKNVYIYKDTKCTNSMCLHFELINLSSAALNITSQNFRKIGYADLKLNLIWLDPFIQQIQ